MRETSLEAGGAGGRQTPSPRQESEGATPEQRKYGWREGAEPLGGRINMIREGGSAQDDSHAWGTKGARMMSDSYGPKELD